MPSEQRPQDFSAPRPRTGLRPPAPHVAVPDGAVPGEMGASTGPCLQSDMLLRGNSSVAILHNGSVYRLQATRLGKLILTK